MIASEGRTPLFYAVSSENTSIDDVVETCRALLDAGADPNIAEYENSMITSGATALHWAARGRDLRIVEVLLRYGADRVRAINGARHQTKRSRQRRSEPLFWMPNVDRMSVRASPTSP